MDNFQFIETLLTSNNPCQKDVVDELNQMLNDFISQGSNITENLVLASFIFDLLSPSLEASDPISHFEHNRVAYNEKIHEITGPAVQLNPFEFSVFLECKKIQKKPKSEAYVPSQSSGLKVARSLKEKERDKKLFSEIYMTAARNTCILEDPQIAMDLLDKLNSGLTNDYLQNELLEFLGFDNIEVVEQLLTNRRLITETCKSLSVKKPEQKLLDVVTTTGSGKRNKKQMEKIAKREGPTFTSNLDVLRELGFDEKFLTQNNQLGLKSQKISEDMNYSMPFSTFQQKALPSNLQTINEKMHIEFVLPAPIKKNVLKENLISIDMFKEWCRPAFSGITHLNEMQSIVYPEAYFSNHNLLVSAPTGAGKTNIALMCVLKALENSMVDGVIDTDIKIIYVAPMKALASEVTEKFSSKLKYLGLFVKELTGDMQLTKTEFAKTQMIVTTPEKWDVVTRKSDSSAIKVKLLVLDEIHLLDDERGPVLEALVARTLRLVETSQEAIRIVGLSATLPNYKDVAEFLRVGEAGCFYFGGEFRPVPLEQRFIGVNQVPNLEAQKALMNEITYAKVLEQIKRDEQVLVFVHSRRDTIKTCFELRDLAVQRGEISWFEQCYSMESKREVEKSKNRDLRQIFEFGMGIHNAGMLRKDRDLTERLFKKKNIRVLVTTATLAWGVNLPAHAVIIKGTDIYDSSIGNFKDIGILDVQQIFGRAGRPDFDTSGVAMILTTKDKIEKYKRMLVDQRSIESKFLNHLRDSLNAEVSLGTVSTIHEAFSWLRYTYFFVRVKRNPLFYGFNQDEVAQPYLLEESIKKRIKDAARGLNLFRMIRYDEVNGNLAITAVGRTASNFYINCESIQVYVEKLNVDMMDEEFFDMFCESHEFKQLKMREDENEELMNLADIAGQNWIEIKKEDVYNTYGKVMALLFAYLSSIPITTFSLVADMAYIVQNGARIIRALFEMVLKRNWAYMSEKLLTLSRNIDRRLLPWSNPLYQFTASCNVGGYTSSSSSNLFMGGFLAEEIVEKVQSLGLSIEKIQEIEFKELTFLLRREESARILQKFISYLPKLEINYTIHPISSTISKVTLEFINQFTWKERWHGNTLVYWVWVDDGNDILHYESFVLHYKSLFKNEKPSTTFAIPTGRYKPGDYIYLRCFSDRWAGADTTIRVEIDVSLLPTDDIQHTELLDLNPLPKSVLNNPILENLYKFDFFNPIQSQTFHTLYYHDTNVLVGAPTGSGKTITAEIAMFRVFNSYPDKKIIYIAPLKALAKERLKDWTIRLGVLNKSVLELTGDYTPDIVALNNADVLITTPEKWDGISRNWQHRSYVQRVGLVVIDEIHLLGQDRGPVLEVIVSRMRFMSTQINSNIRIIGLSTALANAQDLANWLGIEPIGFFNFKPSVRPVPLQVHVDGFPEKNYCPRMATMNRPAYNAIKTYSPTKPVLIFVASRRQTRLTAFDLIAYCAADRQDHQGFLKIPRDEMEVVLTTVHDENLHHSLSYGIGLHHAGLSENDRKVVEELFVTGKIQILVTTTTLAWGVNFPAHLVIIKGSEFFDAKAKKYVDFPITDILQMMGRAGRPQFDDNGIVCIYVLEEKRAFLKTFLYQPFPVESSLQTKLLDHVNAEIAAGTLVSRGSCINYMTWTYFYRRLTKNPGYYGLLSVTYDAVNHFLLSLIDETLNKLADLECVEIEDDYLTPLPMGHIASYYYINCISVKYLKNELSVSDLSFDSLIEILSRVEEFSELPVRHNEENLNEELAKLLNFKAEYSELDSPHTKTQLLLLAHLSRVELPISDYITDTKLVLDQSVRLLNGMVEISSQVGTLSNTLKIATLLQMLTQGHWFYHSTLSNLPGLSQAALQSLHNNRVTSLAHLIEMDGRSLPSLFESLSIHLSKQAFQDLRKCISALPLFEISWTVKENKQDVEDSLWGEVETFREDALVEVVVKVESRNRTASKKAQMSRTGRMQDIGLWVMIGCKNSDKVLAIKKLQFPNRPVSNFNLTIQVPRNPQLCLLLVHDAYIGLDQEYEMA
jgi:activating signal cointegrator complex subunit 3